MSALQSSGSGSSDIRKQLIEARRQINKLSLACRQTVAYLDGISAMDNRRLKRSLQDAIRESERFTRDN